MWLQVKDAKARVMLSTEQFWTKKNSGQEADNADTEWLVNRSGLLLRVSRPLTTDHFTGGRPAATTTLTGPPVWPAWIGGSSDTGTGTTDSVSGAHKRCEAEGWICLLCRWWLPGWVLDPVKTVQEVQAQEPECGQGPEQQGGDRGPQRQRQRGLGQLQPQHLRHRHHPDQQQRLGQRPSKVPWIEMKIPYFIILFPGTDPIEDTTTWDGINDDDSDDKMIR